mgnify:CR=1 FL=1
MKIIKIEVSLFRYIKDFRTVIKTKNYIFFIFFIIISLNKTFTQEKGTFLQQRFDGFTEIISKDYTLDKLLILKNNFVRSGVDFKFSKTTFNKKNEIIRVTIKISNKESSASLILEEKNTPIPSIKLGEIDNIVIIEIIKKPPFRIGPNKEHPKPLYVLNNHIISSSTFEKIDSKDIISIAILKRRHAQKKYGQKGKNGAILITTKK